MAESEEVLDLRRRARRRLIGASALVLFLVVVPPWLMDLEPRPVSSNLNVEIPGKDAPKIDPRAIPVPPLKPEPESPKPAATALPGNQGVASSEPKPAPPGGTTVAKGADAVAKPAAPADTGKAAKTTDVAIAKPAAPAPKSTSDSERAAAILKNEVFYFQLGAFSNPENAKAMQQKASQAGVKSSADTVEVKGVGQTRVVAGPFTTREAAEKARTRIKEVGLEPGPVRSR